MEQIREYGVQLDLKKQSGEWTLIPEGEARISNNKVMVKLEEEGIWFPIEQHYEKVTGGEAPVRWSTEQKDGFEYF